MNKKSVSIIIPVYNTQDYIEECLDSISNQTYFENFDGYEILVGIDNCEKSLNKINEIKHKYKNVSIFWFEENVGAYIVMNTLICQAKHDIFIPFGSDDIMQPYFVEKNIALVENDNYVIAKGSNFKHPGINNLIGTGNMDGIIITYKYNFEKLNGYKEWRCAADSDFNNRLNLLGIRRVYSNDITFLRRIHETNLTISSQYGHNSEYRSNIVRLMNDVKEHDIVNKTMVVCTAIKNITDMENNSNTLKQSTSRKVDVYIASLWRDGHIIKTVESILKNKSVATITIACNNYTDDQWNIVNEKLNDQRVSLHRTNNEKGSCEKLRFLNNGNINYYVSFADDDIIYPEDYYEYLISGVEKYNAYVSLHGRIIKSGHIENYYKDAEIVYRSLDDVNEDHEVDIASNCGSVFKRSFFNDLDKWYDYAIHPNMDDIYTNFFAKQHGIKRVVLKHKKGYLQHKEQKITDNYIYDNYHNNCKIQTDFINEHFNTHIFDSKQYWENRYKTGRDSGSGSYNRLAEFKASIINDFILKNNIQSVVEFGCGDGNQLSKFNCKNYTGYDVSETIIQLCKEKFKNDNTKKFYLYEEYNESKFELSLSLDVIFHLIENDVFHTYMNNLFKASNKYVIIYSSNGNMNIDLCEHVKDRNFTVWINENQKKYKLIEHVHNPYVFDKNNPTNTSFSDFFIYEKIK